MKNDKGFSLVELLAVIVVLGILITVATFTYQSILNNSKNKVYKEYEITMKDAAMMFVIKNGVPSGSKVTMSDLVSNQYLDKFVDPEDAKDCPDSYVTVIANSNYSDISYNACLICNSYKTENCVEPPKRDESKPDCFFSNPSSLYAGLNGTITVDLTCTDDGALKELDTKKIVLEKDGVFEIKSISSKETITNGYKWKVTIKAKSEASGELKTKLKILQGAIKDRTNNENDEKYSINDFAIDTGTPTITYSIASGSYNKDVDLKITSVDALSGINYMDIKVYKNGSLYSSYDKVSSPYDVKLNEEGEWTVSTKAYDKVGNVQNQDPNKDGYYYQTYKIDKTKPQITYSPTSNSYNTSKTITIKATDAGGSGLNYMNVLVKKNGVVISNKSANNITSGTYQVTIDSEGEWIIYSQAFDNVSNTQNQSPNNGSGWYYQKYTIDMTKPVCSFSGPSPTIIRKGTTATYTLSCTDSAGFNDSTITSSDITISSNVLSVSVSNKQNITNGFKYTVTVTGTNQGSATLTLKSGAVSDKYGNVNNQATSSSISVDTTAPTISFDTLSGSYTVPKTITITFADNMSSIVERNITINKDGSNILTNSKAPSNTYTYNITDTGSYVIYANAIDAAGNSYYTANSGSATLTLTIVPNCTRQSSCGCETYGEWREKSGNSCSSRSNGIYGSYKYSGCVPKSQAGMQTGCGTPYVCSHIYVRYCIQYKCC